MCCDHVTKQFPVLHKFVVEQVCIAIGIAHLIKSTDLVEFHISTNMVRSKRSASLLKEFIVERYSTQSNCMHVLYS